MQNQIAPPPNSVGRAVSDLWKGRERRIRQNFLLYLSEVFAGDNSPMENSGRFALLSGNFTGIFASIIDLGS